MRQNSPWSDPVCKHCNQNRSLGHNSLFKTGTCQVKLGVVLTFTIPKPMMYFVIRLDEDLNLLVQIH